MKRSEPAKNSATTTPRPTAILTIHRPLATSTPVAGEGSVVTWKTSQRGTFIIRTPVSTHRYARTTSTPSSTTTTSTPIVAGSNANNHSDSEPEWPPFDSVLETPERKRLRYSTETPSSGHRSSRDSGLGQSLLMQTPPATKAPVESPPTLTTPRTVRTRGPAGIHVSSSPFRSFSVKVSGTSPECDRRPGESIGFRFSGAQLAQSSTPRPLCTIQESCVSEDSALNVSLPSTNESVLGERSSAIETPSKGLRQQTDENAFSSDYDGGFRVTSTPVKDPTRMLTCFSHDYIPEQVSSQCEMNLCGGSEQWLMEMLPPLPPYSPLKSQKTPSKSTADDSAPSTSASVRPRILATPKRKSPKSDVPFQVEVEESVVEHPWDVDVLSSAEDPSESRPTSAAAKTRGPRHAFVPARIRRDKAIRQRYIRRAFGGLPDQVQVTRAAREFLQRCDVAPHSPLKFVEPLDAWHAASKEPHWSTLFV